MQNNNEKRKSDKISISIMAKAAMENNQCKAMAKSVINNQRNGVAIMAWRNGGRWHQRNSISISVMA